MFLEGVVRAWGTTSSHVLLGCSLVGFSRRWMRAADAGLWAWISDTVLSRGVHSSKATTNNSVRPDDADGGGGILLRSIHVQR